MMLNGRMRTRLDLATKYESLKPEGELAGRLNRKVLLLEGIQASTNVGRAYFHCQLKGALALEAENLILPADAVVLSIVALSRQDANKVNQVLVFAKPARH